MKIVRPEELELTISLRLRGALLVELGRLNRRIEKINGISKQTPAAESS